MARKPREDVFLPREFADLGGEDQVLRVLRGLVREGHLVRLGYGVYGRAVVSQLSGEPILYSPNGFAGAARQALNKLGVKWQPTEAERAYQWLVDAQRPDGSWHCRCWPRRIPRPGGGPRGTPPSPGPARRLRRRTPMSPRPERACAKRRTPRARTHKSLGSLPQ